MVFDLGEVAAPELAYPYSFVRAASGVIIFAIYREGRFLIQKGQKLIIDLLLKKAISYYLSLSFLLPGIARSENITRKATIKTPTGEIIKLSLAIDHKEQEKGLSGVKKSDFKKDQGMLFFYLDDQERNFWMPDTYFDLDIFYLDKDLEILKVHRDVPHHPGKGTPPAIPRVPAEHARHVLEMRSDSKITKGLKPGDKLIWNSTPALWQIERDIRLEQ